MLKYVAREKIGVKSNQIGEKESRVPQVVQVYRVLRMKRVIALFEKRYRLIVMTNILKYHVCV